MAKQLIYTKHLTLTKNSDIDDILYEIRYEIEGLMAQFEED